MENIKSLLEPVINVSFVCNFSILRYKQGEGFYSNSFPSYKKKWKTKFCIKACIFFIYWKLKNSPRRERFLNASYLTTHEPLLNSSPSLNWAIVARGKLGGMSGSARFPFISYGKQIKKKFLRDSR